MTVELHEDDAKRVVHILEGKVEDWEEQLNKDYEDTPDSVEEEMKSSVRRSLSVYRLSVYRHIIEEMNTQIE